MTPEDRKLMQQLRDALNEYQPCDHANTEIVSAGWHDCKQCGELIRPAHYTRDREDAARVAEIIAAADAYLALPEPPQKPTAYVLHKAKFDGSPYFTTAPVDEQISEPQQERSSRE